MKHFRFLFAMMLVAGMSATSQAGLLVFGEEISSGTYQFTFGQDASVDPIQNASGSALSFSFLPPFSVIFPTASGTITDGTTSLEGLGATWVAQGPGATTASINPNLISSPASIIITNATAGVDVTTIQWQFNSSESLTGTVQSSSTPPSVVPEPTSLALFAGFAGLMGFRRRKRA
ncbi:MAG: PEP-CTERM sorting domain-containing protein [Planctomycetota bacterium]